MPTLSELLDSKKTVFIGSGPENDIILDDPQVAPIHCQVSKIKNGAFMVIDMESETGTYINDQRISKSIAGEYDTIRIGSHVFQLKNNAEQTGNRSEHTEQKSNRTEEPPKQATANESFRQANDSAHSNASKSRNSKEKIVVYFLAAPEDEATCEAVHKHLSTIRFSSPLPIEMIGDFKMTGGEDIAAYREKVNQADIYLAFVSVDFLNNNACYELLKTAIDNQNRRKAILLPILVRNCMWKTTPFASLPLLPKNQQPLNNKQYWNSEDDALTSVADDIYHSISELTKNSTPEAPIAVTTTPTLQTNWRGSYLWKNFWKRAAAYLLDVIIIMVPLLVVLYLVFGDEFFEEAREEALLYGLINTSLLILVYSFFDSSRWRGTPGKSIMKLQITDDVGNPISFGKAFSRNAFKFFLFGFVGGLDQSGVISLLIIIGQVGCYIATKKFIHDYLTHTVIGERVKLDTAPVKTEAGQEPRAGQVQVRSGSRTMATTVVGILAIICIVMFVVFKFIVKDRVSQYDSLGGNYNGTSTTDSNLPVASLNSLTDEVKESLMNAVKYGDATETEAFRNLDASLLSKAFTGEKLQLSRTDVEQLIQQRRYYVATLENQVFHQFSLGDDGQTAQVQVTETWSGIYYSVDTDDCLSKTPAHAVPQTVYLQKLNDSWMITNIAFENAISPQPVPCNDFTD